MATVLSEHAFGQLIAGGFDSSCVFISQRQIVSRLLTIAQASAETGLSAKAIARRIERGTLRAVHDEQGRRVVPRAELDRAGLLGGGEEGHPDREGAGMLVPLRGSPGELVLWRDLYEREREAREELAARERELHAQLVAIANAGPIRAMRLRRQARRQLDAAVARETLASVDDGQVGADSNSVSPAAAVAT